MAIISLDLAIFDTLSRIAWVAHVGKIPPASFGLPCVRVTCPEAAVSAAATKLWTYVGSEAQNGITGTVAMSRYDLYSCHWGRLVDEAQLHLNQRIVPALRMAFNSQRLAPAVDRAVLDLCRIAMYATYVRHVRKLPPFFAQLLQVYSSGHFPCGWDGDLYEFPKGRLLVY